MLHLVELKKMQRNLEVFAYYYYIYIAETAPLWLGHFEKLKQKNNGDWFVGKTPSIADCYIYDVLDVINSYIPGIVNKYEHLHKFMESFVRIPNIDAYMKSDRRLKN